MQDLALDAARDEQWLNFVLPRCLVGKDPFHRAANDQRENLLFRYAGCRERAVKATVAQHADAIGDAADFRQAMRNVDDGSAVGLDARDLREEALRLGRGQGLGRLVKHQNLWPQRQRLGDLDQLPFGHAEIADPGAAVEMSADCIELLLDPDGAAFRIRTPGRRHAIEQVPRRP